MAPIVTHKDPSKEFITHVCTGQISVDEILTVAQEYFSGEVTKDVLWDFAEAEVDMRQPQIDKLMVYLRSLPGNKGRTDGGGELRLSRRRNMSLGSWSSSRVGLRWLMPYLSFRCSMMQKMLWPG
jgi:hypothetical protein